MLFRESFAILIFGDGFNQGAVEIPTFRLDRAPLCFDLREVAPQFDAVCRRESDPESRGFCKKEFNELVAPVSWTKHSNLRCRSTFLHEDGCEKDIKRAVCKELCCDVTCNFGGHIIYIRFDDVNVISFGVVCCLRDAIGRFFHRGRAGGDLDVVRDLGSRHRIRRDPTASVA